jgi:hypothetical protein
LAISRSLTFKSKMDSSSFILWFLNSVVRSYNLDIRTLDVPSWTVLWISKASLASVHVLIKRNMLSLKPLKTTFKNLWFLRASLSSTSVKINGNNAYVKYLQNLLNVLSYQSFSRWESLRMVFNEFSNELLHKA